MRYLRPAIRDELRWQVTFGDELAEMDQALLFNEAPVHEVCALYAAQVCPFVSSPYARFGDEQRKGMRRGDSLVLAGFEQTASVFGQRSELQTQAHILIFDMAGLQRTHRLANAHDARTAYAEALKAEAPIELDPAEQRVVEILGSPTPEDEDSSTVMAGGAWIIGAAFCEKIRKVMAMKHFAEAKNDFYFQLAATFLFDPTKMAAFEDGPDASFSAAVSWFRTRPTLPQVLHRWRADGALCVRDTNGRRPGSGSVSTTAFRDDAAIRRRKAAEAARRKSRRRK